MQRQKPATAYILNKQILPFGFPEQDYMCEKKSKELCTSFLPIIMYLARGHVLTVYNFDNSHLLVCQ